jgi:hypothetical protein
VSGKVSESVRSRLRLRNRWTLDRNTTGADESEFAVAPVVVNDRYFAYRYRPLLTASVAPSGATGTVTFRDGSRVLGTVTVTRGKAALRAPVLSRGTHSMTATYNGSGIYNPSASAALGIRVR